MLVFAGLLIAGCTDGTLFPVTNPAGGDSDTGTGPSDTGTGTEGDGTISDSDSDFGTGSEASIGTDDNVDTCLCIPVEECDQLAFERYEAIRCPAGDGFVCCHGACDTLFNSACVPKGSSLCYTYGWSLHSTSLASCASPDQICCEEHGPECRFVGVCDPHSGDEGIKHCLDAGGTAGRGCKSDNVCCVRDGFQ